MKLLIDGTACNGNLSELGMTPESTLGATNKQTNITNNSSEKCSAASKEKFYP